MSDWLQNEAGAHKARFVDHSGLGDASRISTGEMVRSLMRLSRREELQPLLKEIPMRDAKDQLVDVLTKAKAPDDEKKQASSET